MQFILASISGRIQSQIPKKNLPRFAPPCDLFWLQSTVEFIANTRELLPRFARPNDILWLQSLVQFRANFVGFCLASLGQAIYFCFNLRSNSGQTFESFCLASLGHAIYFGFIFGRIQSKIRKLMPRFAPPCDLFWLQYPVEFRANTLELLPRFAWPCDLCGLQAPAEFRLKTQELLPRFAWRYNLFKLNRSPNLEQTLVSF